MEAIDYARPLCRRAYYGMGAGLLRWSGVPLCCYVRLPRSRRVVLARSPGIRYERDHVSIRIIQTAKRYRAQQLVVTGRRFPANLRPQYNVRETSSRDRQTERSSARS